MEEYKEVFENESRRELEKIDITSLFVDFCQGLRKLWWLILVLTVVFAIRGYFATSTSYVSQYVAEATVSVTSSTGSSAEDMAQIFPYILSSGVLADVVAEDMGLTQIPGTVSAVADEGTNLLTISVTSSDPQVAYNTLQSVLKNYPEVAEFVVGKTKLTVLDETGIPSDTRREEVIRGSYKRGALKGAGFGFAILAFYVLTRRTVKSKKELKNQINQDAVRLIKEMYQIDMEAEGQHSKLLEELPPLDGVVTMGCNVQCPVLPCRWREDWGLDDPTGQPEEVFVETIRRIEEKILQMKSRFMCE